MRLQIYIVAILTYAYATLRQCASKNPGKYRGEQAILHDGPVTGTKIFGFIKDNIEILKNEQEFQGEDGLFALKQLQMVLMDVDADNNTRSSDGELVVFNDKDPKQLCYGITLNKAEKRIVVSFRGTSSFYDAIDDIKVAGAKVANPLYGETKRQKSSLQLHQGFYGTLPRINVDEQSFTYLSVWALLTLFSGCIHFLQIVFLWIKKKNRRSLRLLWVNWLKFQRRILIIKYMLQAIGKCRLEMRTIPTASIFPIKKLNMFHYLFFF